MLTIDAALLCGGLGRRFSETTKASLPKQFQPIGKYPVFIHALKALLGLNCVRQVVIPVPRAYIAFAKEQIAATLGNDVTASVRVIRGGGSRQESSRLALEAMANPGPVPTRVLVHDACRPYLSPSLLSRVLKSAQDRSYGAWVPVVPVTDTLKKVSDQRVVETLDRADVQRVQTPQIFEYEVIRSLLQTVKDETMIFTDDAAVCEYYGIPVGVFEGDLRNLKLTYDFEKLSLGSFLEQREQLCESELVTIPTA
jgi:2-C-methyl-D-erythritol 4-phosphate cytidylyltransferase/2-C-methyl-D-erythritol 2,4-cyclodiphosphate synthase